MRGLALDSQLPSVRLKARRKTCLSQDDPFSVHLRPEIRCTLVRSKPLRQQTLTLSPESRVQRQICLQPNCRSPLFKFVAEEENRVSTFSGTSVRMKAYLPWHMCAMHAALFILLACRSCPFDPRFSPPSTSHLSPCILVYHSPSSNSLPPQLPDCVQGGVQMTLMHHLLASLPVSSLLYHFCKGYVHVRWSAFSH